MEFNVHEEDFQLPKLTIINKRFRDLALAKHSDKGGNDAEFMKLYSAWKRICEFYNNMEKEGKDEDGIDNEQEIIMTLFKDFNFCKQNQSSFTVIIENEKSSNWDEILEKKYGRGDEKGPNGIHWTPLWFLFS